MEPDSVKVLLIQLCDCWVTLPFKLENIRTFGMRRATHKGILNKKNRHPVKPLWFTVWVFEADRMIFSARGHESYELTWPVMLSLSRDGEILVTVWQSPSRHAGQSSDEPLSICILPPCWGARRVRADINSTGNRRYSSESCWQSWAQCEGWIKISQLDLRARWLPK